MKNKIMCPNYLNYASNSTFKNHSMAKEITLHESYSANKRLQEMDGAQRTC